MLESFWNTLKKYPQLYSKTKQFVISVSSATSKLYQNVYNILSKQLLADVFNKSTMCTDLDVVRKFVTASIYSEQLYKENVPNSTTISNGSDNKPDCVVVRENDEVWVVARGTETIMDMLTDLTWITSTHKMESELTLGDEFEFPIGVFVKAKYIFNRLISYLGNEDNNLDTSSSRSCNISTTLSHRKNIRRVYFVGHSLGGSLATVLHIMFSVTQRHSFSNIPSEAYSIGAPLLFYATPGVMATCPSGLVAKTTHNLVSQLDPVPRLLGSHPLPTYVKNIAAGRISRLGSYFSQFINIVNRQNYRPFGNYYLLQNSVSVGSTGDLFTVESPPGLYHLNVTSYELILDALATFPPSMKDFILSLNDHDIRKTRLSLEEYKLSKTLY